LTSAVILMVLSAAVLGLGLGAAAMFAVRLRRLTPPAPLPPPLPAEPADEPDEPVDLRGLIDGTEELRGLYGRIGFPPEIEHACERILGRLEALVRTEIPDFAAFRAAVADAGRGLEGPGVRFPAEDVELLREVERAGDDHEEVLRVLDRAPARRLLPFVEQIPLVRNGERIWRTPVELSLMRKRPADPKAFEDLLDELERLLKAGRPARAEPLRQDVLEAVVRVRRDARRANVYMPTSLRALGAAVEAWLQRAPLEARRRREELDALLLDMLRLRQGTLDGADPREAARAQAKSYAGSPWMHTPWLTAYVLTNLLDIELAALPDEERRLPSPRAGVLRWVRDEVASSHFDSEETIRRLRQQEERELYVHSLVYALLRMGVA